MYEVIMLLVQDLVQVITLLPYYIKKNRQIYYFIGHYDISACDCVIGFYSNALGLKYNQNVQTTSEGGQALVVAVSHQV